jgi:toxin ParE1/3/4
MGRVRHTALSRADYVDILVFLRAQSPQGARKVRRAILKTLSVLADFPYIGRARPAFGVDLRSYPAAHYRQYLIFYRPTADGIEVMRILHGARNLPRQFPSP